MILTAGPSITEKEIAYVNDAVKNGWNKNWNSYIIKLEEAFKNKFNVKHALLTSSCTGAMHLGLKALGVCKGDEVIVPDLTWVATASVVRYVGAKPIFVDVDKFNWTIDPDSFKNAITKNTKVVIPVHLYGHPSNMESIISIAKENGIKIMEDAAPAIGASYNGKYCGTFGDAAAFSFQGAKMMVTGEGGIFLTNNSKIYEKVFQYSEHGRSSDPDKSFWIEEIGYKYKISNIQAALGLAQFERIDELINKKRLIFSWYEKRLKNIEGIDLNKETSRAKSIYWMSSLAMRKNFGVSRDELIKRLKIDGIDTRPVFPTISKYPMWYSENKNKNAQEISQNGINLPSGHNLSEDHIDHICNILVKHLEYN